MVKTGIGKLTQRTNHDHTETSIRSDENNFRNNLDLSIDANLDGRYSLVVRQTITKHERKETTNDKDTTNQLPNLDLD